jgi:hypothetical protein
MEEILQKINIDRFLTFALFNSGFSNTILFYSNVCYIYNERPSSSQKVHWLYTYIYYIGISIYKSYYVSEQKTKNINVYNLFKHKYNTRIKDKMSLLRNRHVWLDPIW